ncbi:lytic transglycosylase domain-containing protein [Crenobacter cavernae]|uniref:lytic transglycosylase domain-containing protein n=1 Tax=Crenobacter cavernae TaxID=2290923 RepID=UPI001FE5AB21|nr:lytic transglycosylase domain-containing protein [Crenobacter cavernae]
MIRFLLLFATVATLLSATARAEVWGYVDEQGQAHLAERQVDERYRLFHKNGSVKGREDAVDDVVVTGKTRVRPDLVAGLPKVNAPKISAGKKAPYRDMIAKAARDNQLDAALLHAIVSVESGYRNTALSPKGAVGLMQVMPATGERFGVTQLNDPRQNLKAGARYLKFLLTTFNGNLPLVIAAYNAGEGAVQKYKNRIPPYPETRGYVAKVLASYQGGADTGGTTYAAKRVRVIIKPDQAL